MVSAFPLSEIFFVENSAGNLPDILLIFHGQTTDNFLASRKVAELCCSIPTLNFSPYCDGSPCFQNPGMKFALA
jgi:hypothetical protein